MKLAIMIGVACLSLGLSSTNLYARPAAEVEGIVTAKRSGELKVTYTANRNAAPQPGDKVDFIFKFQGIDIDAGRGEVSELGDNAVWIKIISGKPDLKHIALIHASGKPKAAKPVPSQSPAPPPQPMADDAGWVTSGSYQEIDPAQRYLSEITAAHQGCDYQLAFRIAEQAKRELPDNRWLQQNYSTLQTLSDRTERYRQSLEKAYKKLEKRDINGSIEEMKLAMQNASAECGQDQQVLSLLEQAKQIAQMERDAAIEAARRRGLENAHSSESYRAEIAKKRAERESFGNALSGNLLGLLGLFNTDNSSSYPPTTNSESDREMVKRLVGETEQNNSETLNRWRESQGWSATPAAAQQATTTSPPRQGSGTPPNTDWVSDQVRQSEQNNSEMLNRWRESQGWSTAPPAAQQARTTPPARQGSGTPPNTDWVSDQVRQSEQNNSKTLDKWRQSEGWE